jgi:hypothetical protein
MTVYEQLTGAVKMVEQWPCPEIGETYEMRLTDAEAHLIWEFVWSRWGVAQLPRLISEPCASQR